MCLYTVFKNFSCIQNDSMACHDQFKCFKRSCSYWELNGCCGKTASFGCETISAVITYARNCHLNLQGAEYRFAMRFLCTYLRFKCLSSSYLVHSKMNCLSNRVGYIRSSLDLCNLCYRWTFIYRGGTSMGRFCVEFACSPRARVGFFPLMLESFGLILTKVLLELIFF